MLRPRREALVHESDSNDGEDEDETLLIHGVTICHFNLLFRINYLHLEWIRLTTRLKCCTFLFNGLTKPPGVISEC